MTKKGILRLSLINNWKKRKDADYKRKKLKIFKPGFGRKTQKITKMQKKKKFSKMKEINLQQQEFLKKQIDEERKRKGKKMSNQELLLNKPKLKEIAGDNNAFQKSLVSTKN